MKSILIIVFLFPLLLGYYSPSKSQEKISGKIIYEQKDKEILDKVLQLLSKEKNAPTATLMVKIGTFFKGTPYVAHTLEVTPEQLVVNLREMDCTTYVENCLAIAKTIQSGKNTFDQFVSELQKIRYRGGKIDGYPSRLHYFSDWIYDNQKKGLVKDISKEIANTPYNKTINFMSTHPAAYQQLKDNSQLVQIIAQQEKKISARKMYYIPENKLAKVEAQLQEGDIVGITTNIKGLDIAHTGLLVRVNGRIHLLHESSVAEKVVITKETLEEYLLNSKSATGIMVAQPI